MRRRLAWFGSIALLSAVECAAGAVSGSPEPSSPAPSAGPPPATAPPDTPSAPDTTAPDSSSAPATSEAAARASSRIYLLDRLSAGASLGYFTAERAKILSELHLDFPFLVFREKSVYVRGSVETVTVKTGEHFAADAFEAQDVDYVFEAGARDYLNNRVAIAAFFGQQGRKQLDESGSGSVRYVGIGFESVGFPRPGGKDRFEWRLAAGPTFHEENVESDFIVRGAVLYDLWRGRRSSAGIDGSFDALFDGTQGQTEYRIGPRWTFPLANGIRANLFAEWIRGQNPLLLADSEGWNFGFRYNEGAYSGPHTMELPDIRGVLLAGIGPDHGLGRFDLDLASPEFRIAGAASHVLANLDANVRSGEGTDNLWYIATAGMETALHPRLLIGALVYHRSNHTIDEGANTATNLNIIQVGLRTPGWNYANRLPGQLIPQRGDSWLDRIEASFVPGVVTNSAFTNASSWDLQAGLRLDLTSRVSGVVPFVRGFAEWGEADRRELAAGISTPHNLVFELRYQKDNQYFGEDDDDIFLTGSLVF